MSRLNLPGALFIAGIFALGMFPCPSYAVISTTNAYDSSANGDAILDKLIGAGITSHSLVGMSGSPTGAGIFSAGNSSNLGMDTGIVLGTGPIGNVNNFCASGELLTPGDADFGAIPGVVPTLDATFITFEFVPSTDVITFDLVFASNEYNQTFRGNDACAVFLNSVNVALVTGQPISVVGMPGAVYRPNGLCGAGATIPGCNFNGLSTVITVTASAVANATNTAKIAIADGKLGLSADRTKDSFVFIRANSFKALPPEFTLAKQVSSTSQCSGGPLVYAVSWSNTGLAGLKDLTIYDTLPSGVSYVTPGYSYSAPGSPSVSPYHSHTSIAGPWTAGEPDPGDVSPLYLKWVVEYVPSGNNGWISFATAVSGTLVDGSTVSNSAMAEVAGDGRIWRTTTRTTTINAPKVAISKTHSPNPDNGDTIFYYLTVTNTGSQAISSLSVTDLLPAQVTMTTQTNTGPFTWNGSLIEPVWTGSLTGGAHAHITIEGKVTLCGVSTVNNKATVQAANSCGGTVTVESNNDSFNLSGTGPEMQVYTRLIPANPPAGAHVTYEITVKNISPTVASTSLWVTDVLPSELAYSGHQAPASLVHSVAGRVLGWSGALALAPGASATLSVSGTLFACAYGLISNTVWAKTADSCGNPDIFTSTPAGFSLPNPVPDIYLLMNRVTASPVQGGKVVYRILVANSSANAVVSSMAVSDTLPASLAFFSATLTGGAGLSFNQVGRVISWSGNITLGPRASVTILFDATVGACEAGPVDNSSWAKLVNNCGTDEGMALATSFPLPAQTTVVSGSLIRIPASPPPTQGWPVAYKLVVTNSGNMPITHVLVVDTLPPAINFTGHDEPLGLAWNSAPAGVNSWEGDYLLAPGASLTITITGTVDQCASAPIVNNAWASVYTACGSAQTLLGTNTISPMPSPMPVVAVAVSQTPASPQPKQNEHIYYRVIVTNNSANATAISLAVSDTLPGGLTFYSQTPTGGLSFFQNGSLLGWSGSLVLGPRQSVTINFDAIIGDCASGLLANQAWAYASNTCGPGTQSSGVDVNSYTLPGPAPAITVTKTRLPGEIGLGGPVAYRIVVSNTGAVTADSVYISDTLPPGVVFSTEEHPGGFSAEGGSTIRGWKHTSSDLLLPGASISVTVYGTINTCAVGPISNTAWACAVDSCGGSIETISAVDTFSLPSLTTTISLATTQTPATPIQGSVVTYLLVVTNTSPSATITALSISDTLPTQIEFISRDDPPGMTWNGATSGVLGWFGNITIPPWKSISATITGKVKDCETGFVGNLSWANGSSTCGNGQAASNTGFNLPVQTTAVAISKTVSPPNPVQGGTINYRIVVTNTGNQTITQMTVVDTLPGTIGYLDNSPPGTMTWNGETSGVLGWTGNPALPPGASLTITVTGQVANCVTADISNTAWVSAVSLCGSYQTRNMNVFSLPGLSPILGAVKTHSPATPLQGGMVTYTLVVTNYSTDVAATNLIIVDTLPANVEFVSEGSSPPLTHNVSGQVHSWSGVDLAPQSSFTIVVEGNVGCVAPPVVNYLYAQSSNACTTTRTLSLADSFSATTVTLAVSKTQTPATGILAIGDAVEYRIVVANMGTAPIYNLTVTDVVSSVVVGQSSREPVIFVPVSVEDVAGGKQYVWSAGDPFFEMNPGDSFTFTVTGKVGAVCSPRTVLNNAGVAVDTTKCGTITWSTNTVGFTVYPPVLAVSLAKLQTSSSITGSPVKYNIVVTNTGTATITSMTLVDTISPVIVGASTVQPAGFAAPVPSPAAGGGTLYVWSGSGLTMKPNASLTFTVTGAIGAVCAPTLVSNTAYASVGDMCGRSASGFSNPVGFVVPPALADISVTKIQSPNPRVGWPVIYTITVANNGTATLDSLRLVDTVSPVIVDVTTLAPAVFGSATVSWAPASGTIYAWSASGLGLKPGSSYTFTVTGKVGSVCAPTTVSNQAYASAVNICGISAVDSSLTTSFTITGLSISSTLIQVAPVGFVVGGPVIYRIVVANTGTVTVIGVRVVDTVSAALTDILTDEPAGIFNTAVPTPVAGGGTLYAWDVIVPGTNMPPGTVYTFTVTGKAGLVCSPTLLANSAQAGFDGPCGTSYRVMEPPGSVIQPPVRNLVVSKKQSPSNPIIGSNISYQVVVTNAGTATLTSLFVVDTVSAIIVGQGSSYPTYFVESVGVASGGGTLYSWSSDPLFMKPGDRFTFTVTGKVGAVCGASVVTNQGYALGGMACGSTQIASSVTSFSISVPTMDFTVVKTQFPVKPKVGEAVRYQVVVANTGTATIVDLAVVDTVSAVIIGQLAEGSTLFTLDSTPVGGGTIHSWRSTALFMRPGAVFTFTVTGYVSMVCAPTTVSNTVYVVAVDACPRTLEKLSVPTSFTLTGLSVPVAMVQTPPDLRVGGPVTYLIVAVNNGTVTVANFLVVDTVPGEITGITTDEPAGIFGEPELSPVAGGTRYMWSVSASGRETPPGAVYTFTVTGKVSLVCALTSVENHSVISFESACGPLAQVAGVPAVEVQPPTRILSVAKTQNPPNPGIGEAVSYRIVVKNTGTATLTGLRVVDTVSALIVEQASLGATWFVPSVTGAAGGGTLYSWSSDSLFMRPNTAFTFTITGRVGMVCSPAFIPNEVSASGTMVCGSVEAGASVPGFNVQAHTRSVDISMAHLPVAPAPGNTLAYFIEVRNTGTATITSLAIADTLPVEFIYSGENHPAPLAFTLSPLASGSTLYFWEGPMTLAPGNRMTVTIFGEMACSGSFVPNAGWAGGTTVCGAVEDSITDDFGMPAPGKISIYAWAPEYASVGQTFTVTVTATNIGGSPLTGVFPSNEVFAPIGRITQVGGVIPPVPLTLSPSGIVQFTWTYLAEQNGPVDFSITVSGQKCGDYPEEASETVSTILQIPATIEASIISFPGVVSEGHDFTVTITISNTGEAKATRVGIVSIDIFGSGTATVFDLSSWPFPQVVTNLLGGQSVTFTWTYTAVSRGSVYFSATAMGTEENMDTALLFGPIVSNIVSILAPASLSATLSIEPAIACSGEGNGFILSLDVSNLGDGAVDNVVPTLPEQWGGGTVLYGAGPFPAPPVSIPGNGRVVFTWTYDGGLLGQVALGVTVTGFDSLAGIDVPPAWAVSGIGTVAPSGELLVTVDLQDTVSVGQWTTVSVTVSNTGGTPVTGINATIFSDPGYCNIVSGPAPPGVFSLTGGGSRTISWTISIDGHGPYSFSATATGTTCDTEGRYSGLSAPVVAEYPAVLEASLAVSGTMLVVDRCPFVAVSMTVTNTGEASALFVAPGIGPAGPSGIVSGPVPMSLASLAGGASATFTWTCSAYGAGAITYYGTALGNDENSGSSVRADSSSVPLVSWSPAVLAARVVAYAATRNVGQDFVITLTVTNTGQARVAGIGVTLLQSSGTGTVVYGDGPWPATPVALDGGASLTFTWTYQGGSAGPVVFSASVSGVEDICLDTVGAGFVSSNSVLIQTPARIEASSLVAQPDPVCIGRDILVSALVTNTGDATAEAVGISGTPYAEPEGSVHLLSEPGPISILGNSSATLYWVYLETGPDGTMIKFTATISGVDANTSAPVPTVPVSPLVSNTIRAESPANPVSAGHSPPNVVIGQWFTVRLTVTNNGGQAVTSILPWARTGPGDALVELKEAPPPFTAIPPGGSSTFTWTYSASGGGDMMFSLTVSGITCGTEYVMTWKAVSTHVQRPARLEVVKLVLSTDIVKIPGKATGEMVLKNTGEAEARVEDYSLATGPGSRAVSSSPYDIDTAIPFVLAGGASRTIFWKHSTIDPCGSIYLDAEPEGTEILTGLPLTAGPHRSNTIRLAGTPVGLSLAPASKKVEVGTPVAIDIMVLDACGNGVPGISTDYSITRGKGSLNKTTSNTDARGHTSVTLVVDFDRGINTVRVCIPAAATCYDVSVEGICRLCLDTPGGALSGNEFSPREGEMVLARIYVPNGDITGLEINVYTASGRLVRRVAGDVEATPLTTNQWMVKWDGKTNDGAIVARGVYLVEVRIPSISKVEVLKVLVK